MSLSLSQVAVAVAAVLLVLSGVNPDHFPPWTSFHSEAPAFIAGALLLLACARKSTRLGAPALLVLLLVGSAWIQWTSGLMRYAGDAWVATAYLLTFACAWFWAGAQDGTTAEVRPLQLLLGLLMVLGLLTAFQAIAQWLQVEPYFSGWLYTPGFDRSTGNIGQPNQAATLLLMAVAAGAALVVQRRIDIRVGWLWFLVGGWAVVLTQSRTGLLAATVMVIAFVALATYRPSLRSFRWHAVAWLVFIYAAGFALQAMKWDGARGGVGAEVMTSVGLRPVLWRQLLAAVAERPWTGYGWLQVSTAQQAGAGHVPGIEQVNYAHNIVLDGLVMLGVPLALLVVAACLFWIGGRWKRLLADDGTAVAALFMLMPFGIHCMLELPHAYSYFLVPAGALFGIVASRTRSAADRAWSVPRPAIALAGASFAVLLGFLALEYTAIEEDFRVNRFENRRLGSTPADYEVPHPRLLTQFEGLLHAMRLRAAPGMKAEDVDVLVAASRRYTWAPLQFRAALALGLNGHPAEARHNLEVIKALFHPSIYEEGRKNWLEQQRTYPELRAVTPP